MSGGALGEICQLPPSNTAICLVSLRHAAFLVLCHAFMSSGAYRLVLRSLGAHEAVENLLRDVHGADTAHACLAFLLFLQELPLPVHGSLSMESDKYTQTSASPPALERVGCGNPWICHENEMKLTCAWKMCVGSIQVMHGGALTSWRCSGYTFNACLLFLICMLHW